ncbi:MAG: hypothetical protein AAGM38_07480 [Pseudomonadota bacterium]
MTEPAARVNGVRVDYMRRTRIQIETVGIPILTNLLGFVREKPSDPRPL